MLRCSEVTRLYSTDAIHGAGAWTRLRVRAHLLMCRHCTRYVQELAAIAEAARRLAAADRDPRRIEAIVRRVVPPDAPSEQGPAD